MEKFLEIFPVPGAQIGRPSGYRTDQILNPIVGVIFVSAGFALEIGYDGLAYDAGAGLPFLSHQGV
jgi:hypothetical protein